MTPRRLFAAALIIEVLRGGPQAPARQQRVIGLTADVTGAEGLVVLACPAGPAGTRWDPSAFGIKTWRKRCGTTQKMSFLLRLPFFFQLCSSWFGLVVRLGDPQTGFVRKSLRACTPGSPIKFYDTIYLLCYSDSRASVGFTCWEQTNAARTKSSFSNLWFSCM